MFSIDSSTSYLVLRAQRVKPQIHVHVETVNHCHNFILFHIICVFKTDILSYKITNFSALIFLCRFQLAVLDSEVLIIGDSIVRHFAFNGPYSSDTLCFPGATVASLRSSLSDNFGSYFNFTTKVVFVHVGTNNLQKSFWEKDFRAFNNLYLSLRERFRCARIIFSALLPRWDCEQLYQKSLYYNLQLATLCNNLSCDFFDGSDIFEFDDSYLHVDGLHPTVTGAQLLSSEIENFIVNKLSHRCTGHSSRTTWIPPELKKLSCPKKPKKSSVPFDTKSSRAWGFFNPDIEIEKRRRKNCRPRREKWKCGASVSQDGFRTVTKPYRPPPIPPLPPNRHIPTYSSHVLIPYTQVGLHLPKPSSSCVPLPCRRSKYVLRKTRKKRRRRKRKKKVSTCTCILMKSLV